ncbi:MAG: thioesterase family protein [Cellvibrionales bacterium]|nr:thioesterase family protein [Cellvibrionales bacterium]
MTLLWVKADTNPVVTEHAIRPKDLDTQGHVNNAVALELFELGRSVWVKTNETMLPEEVMPVVSRVNLSYFREIFLESIEIRTELVSDKYFELAFKQQIYSIEHERLCLEGEVFVCLIDKNTKQPCRLKHCFS